MGKDSCATRPFVAREVGRELRRCVRLPVVPIRRHDPGETAARLVRWALEAGFDQAGVAALTPSEQGEPLRRWIERGEHAGMRWIERRREVRTDPSRLLEGARSALCVALQYWPLAGEQEPAGDLWPRVARYARGRDYHDIMGKRLKKLAARIDQELSPVGSRGTRPYVDTGPILERELAARAGLGLQGKSTMLLSRDRGSWFLLGEILLTLDLGGEHGGGVRGRPLSDLCGRCTRCLDSCPTGALVEPYRLDSNRCISYWTIEHRGDLPPPVRAMIGDWVFGCDVCQEVCPWNHRPRSGKPLPGAHGELRLPPERGELDLSSLLELDREGYVERFRGSPMKRAKREGLRRNAAVAMGNRGEGRYLPVLARTLEHASPVLRRHAAWALGRLDSATATAVLRRLWEGELEPSVRLEIESALATCRVPGE